VTVGTQDEMNKFKAAYEKVMAQSLFLVTEWGSDIVLHGVERESLHKQECCVPRTGPYGFFFFSAL
jgi:hypothetical protein